MEISESYLIIVAFSTNFEYNPVSFYRSYIMMNMTFTSSGSNTNRLQEHNSNSKIRKQILKYDSYVLFLCTTAKVDQLSIQRTFF